MRLRWSSPAFGDLRAISVRIEQERNLAAANRVCSHIYSSIQTLRHHPHSGRPGGEPGTRELVISQSPYVVSYRIAEPETVHILRIWHGAQQRH